MLAYCDKCFNYTSKSTAYEGVFYVVAMDGGYMKSDGAGGLITQCPECGKDGLVITS